MARDDGRRSADRAVIAHRWGDAATSAETARLHWMASPVVQGYVNQRITGHPLVDWLSWSRDRYLRDEGSRILVLGCGDGWLERALVRDPRVETIDACDIAADAVARARESARRERLHGLRYWVRDLDEDELPGRGYDLVVAHSCLHHISRLEDLYDRIAGASNPGATILVNEYVGPRRLQFTSRQMEHVARVFATFPSRYRQSGSTGVEIVAKRCPDEATVVAADPSESIRSHEVLPLLVARWRTLERRDFGGALLQGLLWDVVQNFDARDPRDNRVLGLLCLLEQTLEARGDLASDFTFLALTNEPPLEGSRSAGSEQAVPRAVPVWELPRYLDEGDVTIGEASAGARLEDEVVALLLGRPAMRGGKEVAAALARARPALSDADDRDRCARRLVGEILAARSD